MANSTSLSVIFTGGGTGGHLYPALTLAQRLRELEPDARIQFIGTARLEAEKVPAAGFPLRIISVKGLAGSWNLAGVVRKLQAAALLGLGVPVWQSLATLRKFKPDVVVGTGGYVCGPVILAARLLGIPSISVEQNMRPGITTRALARLVDVAALVSEESVPLYPQPEGLFTRPGKPKLVVTGNPVRKDFLAASREEGLAAFKLTPERKTLFVFGGSLGSKLINDIFLAALEALADEFWFRSSVQIIHVTGKLHQPELGEVARRAKLRYQAYPYLDNLPLAVAAADLLVCRGGGTTLAEITARGVPAVVIPWAGAANNEQYYNAKPLAQAGGAIVMQEDEFTPGHLAGELRRLLQEPGRLTEMAQASRALGRPNAADKIITLIRELAAQGCAK